MKRGEITKGGSRLLLTADAMQHHLESVADQIEKSFQNDHQNLALVGIQTRGVVLAKRLVTLLESHFKHPIPFGTLDITLYRDDTYQIGIQPEVKETDLPFSIDERPLILVDDVLFSGRSVRSAMNALVDYGRPRCIRLAVLIDRGHREYPISANFVGLNLPTELSDIVDVNVHEIDGDDSVTLRT